MADDNEAGDNNEATVEPLPDSYRMDEHLRRLNSLHGDALMTEEQMEEELELIYGAKHVIMLFVPVLSCMAVVIATISLIDFFSRDDGTYLIYTPFHPSEGDTGGKTLLKSLLNSLILIGIVVVSTFGLILLYKYRCYKFLYGWIMASSVMILFMFGLIYSQELLKSYNIAMDIFSIVFSLYNFGVVGMFVIFWKGPLPLQQAYLVISAALMSLIFIKFLPEWTLWLVLALLAIWDLIAVLAPYGPLKMLVEMASERGDNLLPGLVYSSTVVYPTLTMAKAKEKSKRKKRGTASSTPKSSSPHIDDEQAAGGHVKSPEVAARNEVEEREEQQNEATVSPANPEAVVVGEMSTTPSDQEYVPERAQRRTSDRIAQLEQDIENVEEKGVKLGLGDFIFYSVLVGKASASGEPTIIIASTIAILMGLFLTLAILVTARKALPALPISITLGLIFNFGTRYLIVPMIDDLSSNQTFI